MSALYWSLAPTGEHPAKARLEDVIGDIELEENACEAFASPGDLAKSMRLLELLTEEEDPGPSYDVVSFRGESAAKRTSRDAEGVYLLCEKEDSRENLVTWLEGLSNGSDAEAKAAAAKALQFYKDNREAWEL